MSSDPSGAFPPPPPPPYPYASTGVAPPPYPGAAVPVPDRDLRWRVAAAVAAAVLLVGLAAGAGALAFDAGPRHPEQWDPRVADIAEFVERQRGLEFEHPVHVYFLETDRYREVAGGGIDQPPTTPGEQEYAERSLANYRALGLMEGSPDLLAANETIQDSGTLAFYSPDDDVVNVRGTDLSPAMRVTLAHELVHALQDQHFDLSPIGESATADESGAARAVVEGDAVSVEDAYIASLSEPDRVAYEAESIAGGGQAEADLSDVPEVLQVLFGSYYAVGNAFVEFWQADAGGDPDRTRIDEVLRRLPSGSHQLFEPAAYVDGDEPRAVDAPTVPTDAEEWERGVHGVDLLFVMLSERIDPFVALTATDGWRGDSYVVWIDTSEQVCVTTRVSLATATDTDEFRTAIDGWAATMPAGAAVRDIVMDGDGLGLSFTSCDPGADADMGLTGQSGAALGYPVTRLRVAAEAIAGGRDREAARCYGQEVVSRITLADLAATERTPEIDALLAAAAAACP